jgi:hypothetical protein
LHFNRYEIYIQHNTALQRVLEQNPKTDFTLRHLPLPELDEDDDKFKKKINRTNRLCVQVQYKTTNKSKITSYFNSIPARDPQSLFHAHKQQVTYALRIGCPADVGFAKVSFANLSSP